MYAKSLRERERARRGDRSIVSLYLRCTRSSCWKRGYRYPPPFSKACLRENAFRQLDLRLELDLASKRRLRGTRRFLSTIAIVAQQLLVYAERKFRKLSRIGSVNRREKRKKHASSFSQEKKKNWLNIIAPRILTQLLLSTPLQHNSARGLTLKMPYI